MRIINIIFGILFFILSGLIFIATLFFKQTLIADMFLGATFFPRIVAGTMAVLSLMLIAGQFSPTGNVDTRKASDIFNNKVLKPLIAILFFIIYIVLLTYLGFFLPTAALFCFILALLQERKKSYYLTGIIFVAAIELIFSKIFLVQLPSGLIGF